MSHIDYKSSTLSNGLKVFVIEDHAVPKAVINLVYKVGARDEDPGKTGFAHLFEHLMFGGSINIPDFDKPLQKVGGDSNAFTNNDFTSYYNTIPSNQLETAFWLESDRMLELDFSQKNLDIQRSVVIEEFKQRYLNKPYGDAHNILRGIHYTTHPYRWPTIGMDISHIEKADLNDVRDFFFGYYAPNNASLVVAGDVNYEAVMNLAEKWFGEIPQRQLRKHALPAEPPQNSPRTKTVHREVRQAAVYKMYHIPAIGSREYFAADLLTDILSLGRASLLYQRLVKDTQIATNVKSFSWASHDPGSISIDCTIAGGKTIEEYESELSEILEGILKVSNDELERVKNKLETNFVLDRTSVLNKAISLSSADARNDAESVNTMISNYLSVTTDEIRQAAGRYLCPENCSTLYYLPQDAS